MKKTKDVYNIDTQQTETMGFICLNQTDKYNYGMDGIDVTSQLCVFY